MMKWGHPIAILEVDIGVCINQCPNYIHLSLAGVIDSVVDWDSAIIIGFIAKFGGFTYKQGKHLRACTHC